MGHCPKCGARVYTDETFCVNCGEKLPKNLDERMNLKKWSFKYFILPISLFLCIIGSSIIIYTLFDLKITQSKDLYVNAEEALLLSDYELANDQINQAIDLYPSFKQAGLLKEFTSFTIETLDHLETIESEQEKLQVILQAKNDLTYYSGEAVDQFHDFLSAKQTSLQLDLLNLKLANDPSIHELPALLWEADSIQDSEAYELVRMIREQLITHATNETYAFLEQSQFRLAKNTVENSLLYSPNDPRLTSLLNSIDKEQEAFEAAQEARLEQAFSQYEVEQEINEHDAVNDLSIQFTIDQHEQLVVSGELTSVATVPIHAVLVHYNLLDEEGEIIESNEIFIYPETLYPGEEGQFERTYVDDDLIEITNDVVVTSVTWLLE